MEDLGSSNVNISLLVRKKKKRDCRNFNKT
jgi:hypothetical protein